MHASLPSLFSDASLQEIRGSEVLHVTSFTSENEAHVKAFALQALLDPDAYDADD